MTRQEVANLTDIGLRVTYDRVSSQLECDWRRGGPGRLVDVYDLALLRLEADIRSLPLSPVRLPSQLHLCPEGVEDVAARRRWNQLSNPA